MAKTFGSNSSRRRASRPVRGSRRSGAYRKRSGGKRSGGAKRATALNASGGNGGRDGRGLPLHTTRKRF